MARKKGQRRQGAGAHVLRADRQSVWERLTPLQQHALCVLLLVVVALGFFAPAVFTDRSLFGGDTVQWRASAESMIAYREATGREALWNPNMFAGMPGYMVSYRLLIPQADFIVRAINEVAWPASTLLVLLLGAYLLVFYLTKDKLAGVLAACAYGLTTYLPVILIAGHNSKFSTLAYAPWVVLAFVHVLRRPRLLSALLFAIALALDLRAGHVQVVYYFGFLLGIWWLVEGVRAWRAKQLRAFGAATGWLALGSVLALLMIAQPYLANFEYKDYTIRGAAAGDAEGGLDWFYAMRWSQGWGELITLAVADAYGGGGGTYWGPKPFTAGPHYVGGIVLLLAGLALWRVRRSAVWALGAGALFMVLFSLGEHFSALNLFMFDHFPLFDAFRVPETWLSTVAFALAVLAGFGLAYVGGREPTAEAERSKTKAIYAAAGVAIGVVAVLLLFNTALFDFERPGEYEQVVEQIATSNDVPATDPRVGQAAERYVAEVRTERADRFRGDALRTLVFLVLAGGVLFAYRAGKLPRWGMQAALALLVVVDLWGVGRRYFNADVLVPSQEVEQEIPSYGFDRFIAERREEAGGSGRFRVLSLESGDPMSNARPSYYFESLGGYHGAKLRLYQDYIDHLLRNAQTGLPNANALDLLNTRYIVARGRLPGMEVVFRDEQTGLLVLENPDAVPRAFFVGETEVVPEPEAMWERIQQASFDPRRTALLSAPIDFETTPLDSGSVAGVTLESYSPREIRWRVETDAPRLLVVSEVYYPAGWQATLDGEPVPVYRADYLLRAVPVPAGEHTLVMRFAPRSHTIGLWMAGTSTALVYGLALVLLGRGLLRRRREQAEAGAPGPEQGAA
jgi:hypothetical protein